MIANADRLDTRLINSGYSKAVSPKGKAWNFGFHIAGSSPATVVRRCNMKNSLSLILTLFLTNIFRIFIACALSKLICGITGIFDIALDYNAIFAVSIALTILMKCDYLED